MSYGVEFLDAEWYYPDPPAPAPLPQPWRSHPLARLCFSFPRALLLEMAQGPRLALIKRSENVAELRASLLAEGLREPLELVVDRAGLVVLRDGHHRLEATEGLADFAELPAYFVQSDRGISVSCATLYDVLDRMLRSTRVA